MLAKNLKTDTVSDNKSACFWCTCNFDNPPVYIPTGEFNGTYHCYGCFCSPECATAFLFQESIDSATRFERYQFGRGCETHLRCVDRVYEFVLEDESRAPGATPWDRDCQANTTSHAP